MPPKLIVLPPTDAQGEARYMRAAKVIGEFMGVDLVFKSQIVLTIEAPAHRTDVHQILGLLIGNGKKRAKSKPQPEVSHDQESQTPAG